ncbi:hypothetical protein AHF37_08555 [Paragonimus kellicotti]|nr:hypothetical protein AHF37_08555 [Paragonimus kellicotti]
MAEVSTDAAVDQLIPALIQCFGVIILGYLAGRWRILSDFEVQGLNSYVTTFALPAVFFKVMVTIDFSDVCWALVAAVSLSKLVAFLLAFCVTLMLSRKSQLGVAAILSMFVSQSNDVALGYPVLYALYGDLASYVYLFAPAQLVVLNPISYAFLEWHDLKQNARQSLDKTHHIQRMLPRLTIHLPRSVEMLPSGDLACNTEPHLLHDGDRGCVQLYPEPSYSVLR